MNAKRVVNRLIAPKAGRIYSERGQAEVQVQIKEILADMLQFGNNAVMNRVKTASAGILGTIVIHIWSCGAANDSM